MATTFQTANRLAKAQRIVTHLKGRTFEWTADVVEQLSSFDRQCITDAMRETPASHDTWATVITLMRVEANAIAADPFAGLG